MCFIAEVGAEAAAVIFTQRRLAPLALTSFQLLVGTESAHCFKYPHTENFIGQVRPKRPSTDVDGRSSPGNLADQK